MGSGATNALLVPATVSDVVGGVSDIVGGASDVDGASDDPEVTGQDGSGSGTASGDDSVDHGKTEGVTPTLRRRLFGVVAEYILVSDSLKSSALKWALQTLACSEGFHNVK